MCLKFASIALVCLGGLSAQGTHTIKDKRHIGKGPLGAANPTDHTSAETGISQQPIAPIVQAGNYFQDLYTAQQNPKELEFGHVAENPNDWEQRFEKINLETLNRQGKVRWGDKNGGYGEHYWDFNHGGHDGDGKASENSETYEDYPEESQSMLTYGASARSKRNPDDDVEFINDQARSLIFNSKAPKHGGNYRRAKDSRSKREPDTPDFDY